MRACHRPSWGLQQQELLHQTDVLRPAIELLRPIRPALAPHLTWIFTLAVHGKA